MNRVFDLFTLWNVSRNTWVYTIAVNALIEHGNVHTETQTSQWITHSHLRVAAIPAAACCLNAFANNKQSLVVASAVSHGEPNRFYEPTIARHESRPNSKETNTQNRLIKTMSRICWSAVHCNGRHIGHSPSQLPQWKRIPWHGIFPIAAIEHVNENFMTLWAVADRNNWITLKSVLCVFQSLSYSVPLTQPGDKTDEKLNRNKAK